jgi:hypothetical protein
MATVTKYKIEADYDRQSDVLYISLGSPRPDEGEDRSRGVVLRYSMEGGTPSGATVIGYRRYRWNEAVQDISASIANHLSVSSKDVMAAIIVATSQKAGGGGHGFEE